MILWHFHFGVDLNIPKTVKFQHIMIIIIYNGSCNSFECCLIFVVFQYNVRSYPTTIFYNQTVPHQFSGHHSAAALVDFIKARCSIQSFLSYGRHFSMAACRYDSSWKSSKLRFCHPYFITPFVGTAGACCFDCSQFPQTTPQASDLSWWGSIDVKNKPD